MEINDEILIYYKYSLINDEIVEYSPSAKYVKMKNVGWITKKELENIWIEKLNVLKKCRGAPRGSPELEKYLDSIQVFRL